MKPGLKRPLRTLSIWGALAWLILHSTTSLAANPKSLEIEDVRVGFDNRFKVGAWTPIRVQVRASADGFQGVLEVIANDDDGIATRTRVPLRVPAGDSTRVTAYTRAGSRSPEFRFRFLDQENNPKGEVSLETLRPTGNLPEPLYATDLSILTLGRVQNVEQITKLPGMAVTLQGSNREVAVSRITGAEADLLPGKPVGYDAQEVVVIDTNDKDLMGALNTRGPALVEWVARGGHVVIAVGNNWQAVKDSTLASILPVKLSGPVRVTDLRALESFAGASAQITPDNVAAQVTRLEGADLSGAKVLSTTASTPLVVRGAYGFGRVTVLSFDIDSPPFSTWNDASLFWVKTLDLTTGGTGLGSTRSSGRLVQTGASGLSSLLRSALDQFSGVRLVPFGWVAFLIFVYVLLIGPFDYFFLKKVVKRMEFTWITFPLIVATVSIGAAYAAYSIKGTELRVNQIDILDIDQPGKVSRGFSYLNIFSPSNRDYEVAFKPQPISPGGSPSTDLRVSWLGSADSGLRGMNGKSHGLTFANEGYTYAPDGLAERIEGLRIPIWSTKSLSAQWFGPASGTVIESDLQQVGPDRLAGTITNRLDVPLKDTIVAFGTQVYYNIPEIAPGATIRIELSLNRQLSGYLGELRRSYDLGDELGNGAVINRANLMRAIMFNRSENAGLDPLSNGSLEHVDLSNQLRLDRPILTAQIDRSVAEAEIGPNAGKPRLSKTTLIRVILPLDRGGGN